MLPLPKRINEKQLHNFKYILSSDHTPADCCRSDGSRDHVIETRLWLLKRIKPTGAVSCEQIEII